MDHPNTIRQANHPNTIKQANHPTTIKQATAPLLPHLILRRGGFELWSGNKQLPAWRGNDDDDDDGDDDDDDGGDDDDSHDVYTAEGISLTSCEASVDSPGADEPASSPRPVDEPSASPL